MTRVNSSPVVLADLLDIVETALATVSRRLPAHVGRDDLASAGKLALVTTLAQAEGDSDEVRAYCFVRVRGAMLDELRRIDSLSRNRRTQVRAVAQAQAALASRHGREATLDELADETRLPIAAISSALSIMSAEADASPITLASLADNDSPSPVETVELTDLQSNLQSALDRLPASQALALRLYYLEDGSLDDIAAQLGVSRERARQVREAGEKKLRTDLIVLSLWQALINQI
ncbi:MAG TPA: sigma-70 family RNA polymerase sigma factor [Candidatus Didemnitutus sp.]|nr:sigma-70 family RNA polymerase sigma factor [Candidatus Didemnitutus sp.]